MFWSLAIVAKTLLVAVVFRHLYCFGTASLGLAGMELFISWQRPRSHSCRPLFVFVVFVGVVVRFRGYWSLCSISLLHCIWYCPVGLLIFRILRVVSLTGVRFISNLQVTVRVGY